MWKCWFLVASFLGFVQNKDLIVSSCFTCRKVNSFGAFRVVRLLRDHRGYLQLDKTFDSRRSGHLFGPLWEPKMLHCVLPCFYEKDWHSLFQMGLLPSLNGRMRSAPTQFDQQKVTRNFYKFRFCKSVNHHTFKWINQPDASISQIYCSSFKYSSTCLGHPLARH
jgi:hypothetical protein